MRFSKSYNAKLRKAKARVRARENERRVKPYAVFVYLDDDLFSVVEVVRFSTRESANEYAEFYNSKNGRLRAYVEA